MKKGVSILLLLALLLFYSSCKQNTDPSISEIKAVAIASTCLSTKAVTEATIETTYKTDANLWHVRFSDVSIPLEELDWKPSQTIIIRPKNDIIHFVLINVNSESGEILYQVASYYGTRLSGEP